MFAKLLRGLAKKAGLPAKIGDKADDIAVGALDKVTHGAVKKVEKATGRKL